MVVGMKVIVVNYYRLKYGNSIIMVVLNFLLFYNNKIYSHVVNNVAPG